MGQVPEGTCGVQGGRLSLGSEKVPPFLVVFFSCVQCVPGPVLGRGGTELNLFAGSLEHSWGEGLRKQQDCCCVS